MPAYQPVGADPTTGELPPVVEGRIQNIAGALDNNIAIPQPGTYDFAAYYNGLRVL